jgi:DNA-binding NarL/FixJ family response regulator
VLVAVTTSIARLPPRSHSPFVVSLRLVQRLDASDVRRLVDAVTEIGSLSHDLPFPPETLELFGTLIPADTIGYCELDRVERRLLRYIGISDDGETVAGDTDEAPDAATFWRLEPQHPLCVYVRSGGVGAMRISDRVTRRELHGLEIYKDYFRPCHVEHELAVALPARVGQTRTFLFDRESRDFSERDRLLLDLLRPHLIRRYASWAMQRRAAAGLAEIAESGASPAVLILDRAGRIAFAQASVRRLLRDYGGDGLVREWAADRHQVESLVLEGRAGQLTVSVAVREASGQLVLLLRELRREPSVTQRLTPRERVVLELAGEGKSNAEIGRLLWVQLSTVRKHLENAYPKLNVRNRTEAAAVLRRDAARSDA